MDPLDQDIEVVFRCKLCGTEAPSRGMIQRHLTRLQCTPDSQQMTVRSPSCQLSNATNISTIEVNIIIDYDNDETESPSTACITNINTGNGTISKDCADIEDHDIASSVPLCAEAMDDEASKGAISPNSNSEASTTPGNPNDFSAPCPLVAEIEQCIINTECNVLKCTFCDYTHINRSAMKNHISTHKTLKSVKCTECKAKFYNKQALNNHWRLHHFGGEHLCDICGFKAQSKFTLFQHKLKCSISRYKCQQCEFISDNIVDLNEHNIARHSEKFCCKRCNDKCTFNTKEEILSHMEEFHPGKSCHFCDKCNFVAKLPNQLRKHYMMHTNERPSKCPIKGCTFDTRNATYLKYHIAKVHNNDQFVCKQCCYVTINQHQLDLHISLHHMKTYKCKQCDFEGKSTTALRRHCLRKHVDSSEMRFKCTKCDYCTQFRDCINKHLLTHEISISRHRCVFCKAVLRSRVELKTHLRNLHPDQADKVLFCDECAYSAARSSNFNLHISRKHSFIKPFKCTLCNYTAKCKVSMRLHKTRKHRMNDGVT